MSTPVSRDSGNSSVGVKAEHAVALGGSCLSSCLTAFYQAKRGTAQSAKVALPCALRRYLEAP